MKKHFQYLILSLLLLCFNKGKAQSNEFTTKIAAVARYANNAIELKWFPENKTILSLGLVNGYTIERSDSGKNAFQKLAVIKPYSKDKWEALIANEKDTTRRNHLELAMEFLFAKPQNASIPIGLESGIANLNELKSKEEMVYAVYMMTAIKDALASEALGLSFRDPSVKTGAVYTYRIQLNAKSAIYTIEQGLISVAASLRKNKYLNNVLVITGDKQLSFVWPAIPEISGYFVERAAEGETNFKPLNTVPFYDSKGAGYEGAANGTFRDDSLINYKWYRYRFYGNTAFGEKVIFAESKAMPKDLTAPDAPVLQLPKHTKPREVLLAWNMLGDITDLKGFIIGRSNKDTGNFQLLHKTILPKTARSFIDNGFDTANLNYYIVYAIDTAGNMSASYPAYVAIIDSIAPAKPEIISAISDSVGVVTIRIKKGREIDLKGYRIYKANSSEHELSVIDEAFIKDKSDTTAIKIEFKDSIGLNSLTPNAYYRIKALDFNYNQSVFSDWAIAKRPDTIPPTTPVFNDVVLKENQVVLSFAPSESVDVKEQFLYRKTDMSAKWEQIARLPISAKQYVDSTIQVGNTYYYTLRARDESNHFSEEAIAVSVKAFDTGIRPPVSNLTAIQVDKQTLLQWDYSKTGKEIFFVIYKKTDKSEWQKIARINEHQFTDSESGMAAVYMVKVLTADAGQSVFSKVVSVNNK